MSTLASALSGLYPGTGQDAEIKLHAVYNVAARTVIGLPAEGYGFSNNPGTFAGLPSFRSVRLNVPRSGLNTRIQMKYP